MILGAQSRGLHYFTTFALISVLHVRIKSEDWPIHSKTEYTTMCVDIRYFLRPKQVNFDQVVHVNCTRIKASFC